MQNQSRTPAPPARDPVQLGEELAADVRKIAQRLARVQPLLAELRDLARTLTWCFFLAYCGIGTVLVVWVGAWLLTAR